MSMMEGGKQIRLVEYDLSWPDQFATHAAAIGAALGDLALQIEHIGSTSVPGLVAKDKVDILLVVPSSADEPAYLFLMEAAGYHLRLREPHWHQHRLFSSPERNANIHVVSRGCSEISRWLTFRDRLRSNPADRDLYATTKSELASRRWRDTDAYAEAKSEVIERIIKWAQSENDGDR
jgi:GrpB-like predicted nucleotidyltransferase (UPF0157 family)